MKFAARFNVHTLGEDTSGDLTFDYVDIGRVSRGGIGFSENLITFEESPSRARRLASPGDTIVSTVRTYLRAVAEVEESEHPQVFSTGFAVISPDPRIIFPRYLAYYLQSDGFVERVVADSVGVSYPAINASDIAAYEFWAPPLSEQRAIADFLDRETAQIDAMIDAQLVLIEKLNERRIAEATDLLASIPPATLGSRLKHHLKTVRQGWSPQCLAEARSNESEWAVLKAGCSNGGTFRPGENKLLPEDISPRPSTIVRKDEIVVARANTRELVGSAAVVEREYQRLMLSDKLYSLRMEADANPHFVAAVLATPNHRDLIQLAATGTSSSMQNISQADILNLPLDLPTRAEQDLAVDTLTSTRRRTDSMLTAATESIALMRERRSALISAAVTGRIDPATGQELTH